MNRKYFTGFLALFLGIVFTGCPDPTPFIPANISVTGIELDRTSVFLSIGAGDKATLNVSIVPSNATNKSVTWTTSKREVVTVANGVLTPTGQGKAEITVTTADGGFTGKCEVEVVTDAVLFYSQFGAVGDGVTDDFAAISAAHAEANSKGFKVKADAGKTYYIGNITTSAKIQTDTDWTDAEFRIDDTKVQRNGSSWTNNVWIFEIVSAQSSSTITSQVQRLDKNQGKLNLPLSSAALLVAVDSNVRRYIRSGGSANSGDNQTDVFVVDKNGNVDSASPVIWDFNTVTSLTSYPIDENTLTVKGGKFTTYANTGGSNSYMRRGIRVMRSNTIVENITHHVTGEGAQCGPYYGFIYFENCANVTLKNSTLSGRKYYGSIGTYDIQAVRTVNLSVINCDQANGLDDQSLWGVFASNYSKNILFDNVKFSRFDAHRGVYNTTIKNSHIGWQGILIIGSGLLTVENTKVSSRLSFISLREDYGSTWEGDIMVKNCIFAPPNPYYTQYLRVISTENYGNHNYGYQCYMPKTIVIDGLVMEDAHMGSYSLDLLRAVAQNSSLYPYIPAEKIFISGFTGRVPYGNSSGVQVIQGLP